MARFRWGAATDVGRLRSANEDAFAADDRVFVVADGMGGHLAGEVAAAMAVDTLQRRLGTAVGTINTVVDAVDEANISIFEASHTRVDQHGMGTTLTAIAPVRVDGEVRLGLVNVGDSRAYAVRGGQMRQLSTDHSYVQELITSGQLTAMEARTHPHRNIVTRALGIEPVVHIDAWTFPLTVGDRFVLCSDGLVDEVLDDTIAEIVTGFSDPQIAAERLVAVANRNGGRDNITVVVVDVLEGAEAVTRELQLVPVADAPPAEAGRWADDHSGDITPPGVVGRQPAALRIVPVADNDETRAVPRPTGLGASAGVGATGVGPPAGVGSGGGSVGGASFGGNGGFAPPLASDLVALDEGDDGSDGRDDSDPAEAWTPVDGRNSGRRGTSRSARTLEKGVPRRFNLHTILFSAAVAAVFVVAAVMIAAYARTGYFVAYRGDQVVVYKGRPDGVLWFDPTVAVISDKTKQDLPAQYAHAIDNRPEFDSLDAAVKYVNELADTPTTVSTVPPVTTTIVGSTAETGATTVPTTAVAGVIDTTLPGAGPGAATLPAEQPTTAPTPATAAPDTTVVSSP